MQMLRKMIIFLSVVVLVLVIDGHSSAKKTIESEDGLTKGYAGLASSIQRIGLFTICTIPGSSIHANPRDYFHWASEEFVRSLVNTHRFKVTWIDKGLDFKKLSRISKALHWVKSYGVQTPTPADVVKIGKKYNLDGLLLGILNVKETRIKKSNFLSNPTLVLRLYETKLGTLVWKRQFSRSPGVYIIGDTGGMIAEAISSLIQDGVTGSPLASSESGTITYTSNPEHPFLAFYFYYSSNSNRELDPLYVNGLADMAISDLNKSGQVEASKGYKIPFGLLERCSLNMSVINFALTDRKAFVELEAHGNIFTSTTPYHFFSGVGKCKESPIGTPVPVDNFDKWIASVDFNSQEFRESTIGHAAATAVRSLVDQILSQFPVKSYVQAVASESVTLGIGSERGVKQGDIFNVYRVYGVENIEGNTVLEVPELVGQVRVTVVDLIRCDAILISSGNIEKGYMAVFSKHS